MLHSAHGGLVDDTAHAPAGSSTGPARNGLRAAMGRWYRRPLVRRMFSCPVTGGDAAWLREERLSIRTMSNTVANVCGLQGRPWRTWRPGPRLRRHSRHDHCPQRRAEGAAAQREADGGRLVLRRRLRPHRRGWPTGYGRPPHPHMGLPTVSWLVQGTVLHRDSIGSTALVEPGRAAIMTAGNGIAHSESSCQPRTGVARSPAVGGAAGVRPSRRALLRPP